MKLLQKMKKIILLFKLNKIQLIHRINTLELKLQVLQDTIKDETYKIFMETLKEIQELKSLRKKLEKSQLKIKELKSLLKEKKKC